MEMNTLFSGLGIKGVKKLFKLYYGIGISEKFIKCMDDKLSMIFEQKTSLKIDERTRLSLFQTEGLFYKKGSISKMPFKLLLPFNLGEVTVLWLSKSRKIYDIADEDIDCDDIEFWFENLDPEFCRQATHPKWSLLPAIYQKSWSERIEKESGIHLSPSFIACMDDQLSAIFIKKTGIKITKRICTVLTHFKVSEPFFVSGNTSYFNTALIVNEEWNPVNICWHSVSNKIYKPSDEVLDCHDIKFGFEGFDADLYIKQYYPNQKLPFKIEDISYELVVTRINLDCIITMKLKPDAITKAEDAVTQIDNFIALFNDKSEKRNRDEGVIHDWNTEIKEDAIIYKLDLGSTGVSFFKRILTFLSKMNLFEVVEIE